MDVKKIWCEQNGVSFLNDDGSEMTSKALNAKLKKIRADKLSGHIKYEVKSMIKSLTAKVDALIAQHQKPGTEVRVLRVPPYHCFLNPIERVWAHMKRSFRKANQSVRMSERKKDCYSADQTGRQRGRRSRQ